MAGSLAAGVATAVARSFEAGHVVVVVGALVAFVAFDVVRSFEAGFVVLAGALSAGVAVVVA